MRQAAGTRRYATMQVADKPLRYGENPHQTGRRGCRCRPRLAASWQVHQGKELSYTNLLDLDAALRIALEFTEPAAVVIKHTNPCGVATGATIAEAYVRAREADPLSAFGGIVGLNRADRRRDRDGADLDVHRSGDRAGDRRGCASDPRDEAEPARR